MGKQIKRAVIIGAAPGASPAFFRPRLKEDDVVICADGGREKAEVCGFPIHWYVGDSDSGGNPEGIPAVTLPAEKDVSDLEMAVAQADVLGCGELVFLCCTGGRADHHLANLGLLETVTEAGKTAVLLDETNEIRFLAPGDYLIPNVPAYHYLGLIPLDREIRGVSLEGVKYPLDRFTLHRGSTRSISNEILPGQTAHISIDSGCVLLIRSQPE